MVDGDYKEDQYCRTKHPSRRPPVLRLREARTVGLLSDAVCQVSESVEGERTETQMLLIVEVLPGGMRASATW